MKLPPLRFKPELVEKAWGGSRLADRDPSVKIDCLIGESWEISDYPGRETRVIDGEYKGMSLKDLFDRFGTDFSGSRVYEQENRFPLLLKILDAQDCLSLQVHPDDEIAKQLGDLNGGKEEAWLILEVRDNAKLALGIKEEIEIDNFFEEIIRGNAREVVNWVKVKAGDFVHISPGLIHAIEPGILLMEIQQTSDATYRLFDWDRSNRPIHITEARRAVNKDLSAEIQSIFSDANPSAVLVDSDKLTLTSHHLLHELQLSISSATILFCYEGNLEVSNEAGETHLKQYDSVLLPAGCKSIKVSGNGRIIEMS